MHWQCVNDFTFFGASRRFVGDFAQNGSDLPETGPVDWKR